MEAQVVIALIGVVSGIIGLLTAIANRKKVIENRHVTIYENRTSRTINPNDKRWYDNHFYVFLGILFFYPIGAYALVQSRTISTFWKYVWFIVGLLWFLAALSGGEKH